MCAEDAPDKGEGVRRVSAQLASSERLRAGALPDRGPLDELHTPGSAARASVEHSTLEQAG